MRKKICRLVLVFFLLTICFDISGCSKVLGNGNKNYKLPTSNQVDNYLKQQSITNLISVDAIDNRYTFILYKIGQNGIGFKVVTSSNGRIIQISDGKTIYGQKMPEVITEETGGEINFMYIYLDESIARRAKEIRIIYFDAHKNENMELVEKVNNKKCFIYTESKYTNIVHGFQSILVFDENGEEINIRQ